MALKTVPTKTTESSDAAASPAVASQETDFVLLELALYTNYTWKDEAFQKGKAYKFTKNNAMQLLTETDHGRPVWRIYRQVRPKAAPKNEVFDATAIKADPAVEVVNGIPDKRIDVGSDDEIADILGRDGDVTV